MLTCDGLALTALQALQSKERFVREAAETDDRPYMRQVGDAVAQRCPTRR